MEHYQEVCRITRSVPNYTCIFLDFVREFVSYVKGLELVALLNLSSWCLVVVVRLFLAVPLGCLRFVIVVFLDHTHLLFLSKMK